jgi:cyclomaltodextrinase / maltogenic alpha-amylase / neopullulanase
MKTRIVILLLTALSLTACNNNSKTNFPEKSAIFHIASPVTLDAEETTVMLEDYFMDVTTIDSIILEGFELILSDDKKSLVIKSHENSSKLNVLNIFNKGFHYSIPVLSSEKVKYNFKFDPNGKKYKKVQLKGEMNAWNPNNTNLVLENEIWETTMFLDPGKYQYMLVLDGKESLDPNNSVKESNNIGGFNSVISAGEIKKELLPILFTYKYSHGSIIIACENEVDEFEVFWQNHHIETENIEKGNNTITIQIPEYANGLSRSYIRIYAANEYGFSNDLFIPLENGEVISNVSQLSRADKHNQIIYNVFVDRFFNGDKANDKPLNSPEVHPRADWHGGDITGIKQKVDEGYFQDLGINTIWISPIVKNPDGPFGQYPEPETKFSGYHGYWPISFTQIDARFGTENEFEEFVNTSHDQNLNVLLDFVANHVHELHPVYQAHKDWATSLYLPDGSLNTEKWDEHRLTTWFDVFLPTLDLSKPEVYNMLSDSAIYWIRKYDLDGFRHDATKHIPEVFWRTLTFKLKNQFPATKHIYQVGETYGTSELIGSYVNSGELDAQFDFNVYDAAVATFAKKETSMEALKEQLLESFKQYGWHNLMANITGNQDRGRFISYASGALKFDEDSKKAGWTREVGIDDPIGYNRLAMLMAFNMSIPGVPSIYYGDEIGMYGGNDPDNRKMMRFSDLSEKEMWLKEITKKVTHLRKNNVALIYGDTRFLYTDNESIVILRYYFDQLVISVFNKGMTDKEISFKLPNHFRNVELKSNFESSISKDNENVSIKLKPSSFEILTLQ